MDELELTMVESDSGMGRATLATAGVADHWGWAILVTVAPGGALLDRRRVELVHPALPKHPHHVEGQSLPVAEAAALVQRVRRSANAEAKKALAALADSVSTRIGGLALRACPPLPGTIAERLTDYRARNVADSVLYREALAQAAKARGWLVHWYEAREVAAEAARVLGRKDLPALLAKPRKALGPPWQKDHQLAMTAAIAASRR